VPLDPNPMDFSAWFEAYLGGRWYRFDARHNHPRIGRILIACGRDAADVAISTSFGASKLVRFQVHTYEMSADQLDEMRPAAGASRLLKKAGARKRRLIHVKL